MLTVFTAVASSIMDSGFGQALIRKKDATNVDFSTIFFFNIAVGLVLYIILFFSSELIANFYNEPKLTDISRVVFLVIIINSFGLIQNTTLTKKIDFKKIAKLNLTSVFLSGTIGVIAAYSGLGVWALVIQTLSLAAFRTIFMWMFNNWRPILVFSYNSFRELFGFGSKLLAAGLLHQIFSNSYQLVIGKYYDAQSVGFYTQANRIQEIPAKNINTVIQSVTYPVLTQIQDDNIRLKEAYRKIIKQIVFINFPVMFLLAIIAVPFIQIFLTEKWLPAAPLLTMLCISSLIYPLHTINLNMLKVKGRSDLFLYLDIAKNTLLVLTLLITVNFSVEVMVLGQVILSYFGYLINAYYGGKMVNYKIIEQVRDVAPYFLTAIGIGILVYSLALLFINVYSILVFQILLYSALYLLISKLFNFDAYREIITIIKKYHLKT